MERDKYYKSGKVIDKYSIIKIIGRGRYGIVYLAENENSEKFIIKQLKNDMLEQTKEKLFYEKEILSSLDSSKFPKFILKLENEDIEGYIMEYIEGRVFEDLLVKDGYKFSKEEIYKIASQLLEIIELLDEKNIVHRDIRPPNVILKDNKELVLIDFGLARYIDDKRYVRQIDYWYVGDFLIHLYYTSFYQESEAEEMPWYDELDLTKDERAFLRKLMGIEGKYENLEEVKDDLEIIKNTN